MTVNNGTLIKGPSWMLEIILKKLIILEIEQSSVNLNFVNKSPFLKLL